MLRKLRLFAVVLTAVSLLSGTAVLAAPGASFFNEPPPQEWEPSEDNVKGYKIIPKVDITITALGRDALGMAQEHKVQVWDVSARSNPTVEEGWGEHEAQRRDYDGSYMITEVLVTPDSPVDSGYHYEELAEPVVLKAGTLYAIVSEEFEDGDWVTYPPTNAEFISELINTDIASIVEDAHNSIPGGFEKPDELEIVPPINYWFSLWSYGEETMFINEGNTGILSSVNFWYEENDAVVEDEAPVETVERDDEIPPTGDKTVDVTAISILLLITSFGMTMLMIRRRNENNWLS